MQTTCWLLHISPTLTDQLHAHTQLLQSCPTLDPVDCNLLGSSVYAVSQARILEWVAISSFRGSSPPRDQSHVFCGSCIGRRILYHESPGKPLTNHCP